MYGSGPQGYAPHDGFDIEPDEDDLEEYPPSMGYGSSGRGTPTGSRKTPNALSMPPKRESVTGYERPRAHTEGTDGLGLAQWRNGLPPMPSTAMLSPDGSVHSLQLEYAQRLHLQFQLWFSFSDRNCAWSTTAQSI